MLDAKFFETKTQEKVPALLSRNKVYKAKKWFIKIIGTCLLPILFLVISIIMAATKRHNLFDMRTDVELTYTIIQSVVSYISLLAVSINLLSGRMDFSLGSIGVLAPMMSVMICKNMVGGEILFIPLSIVFGIILGLISASCHIFLRLPAIVSGLGVCILFEGVTQALAPASIYFNVDSVANFNSIKNNLVLCVVIAVIVLIFTSIIFKYSKYWMNKKALDGNQMIAVDTGVKEIPNVLFSYALAGGLMALSGALSSANAGLIQKASNFSSATSVFDFFPLGIGMISGFFCGPALGLLLGAISNKIFAQGLLKMELNTYYMQIVTPVIMFAFLVLVFVEPRVYSYIKLKIEIEKQNKIDKLTEKLGG